MRKANTWGVRAASLALTAALAVSLTAGAAAESGTTDSEGSVHTTEAANTSDGKTTDEDGTGVSTTDKGGSDGTDADKDSKKDSADGADTGDTKGSTGKDETSAEGTVKPTTDHSTGIDRNKDGSASTSTDTSATKADGSVDKYNDSVSKSVEGVTAAREEKTTDDSGELSTARIAASREKTVTSQRIAPTETAATTERASAEAVVTAEVASAEELHYTGTAEQLSALQQEGAERLVIRAGDVACTFDIAEVLNACAGTGYTVTLENGVPVLRAENGAVLYGTASALPPEAQSRFSLAALLGR